MATDMQPLFSGFPSHHTPAVSEGRDRQPTVQHQGPSRDFDSMLGRAEASQMAVKHETSSARARAKPGIQTRLSTHSKPEASSRQSEPSNVSSSKEQTFTRSEGLREQAKQPSEESVEKDDSQEPRKKSNDQGTVPQEMLVAAMIVPASPAALPEGQATAASVAGANKTEGSIEEVSGVSASGSETRPAATISPGEAAGATSTGTWTPDTAEPGKELKQPGGKAEKETITTEGQDMPQTDGQTLASVPPPTGSDKAASGVSIEPDKMKPVLTAMTVAKQEPKAVEQGQSDHTDRSTILNALSQGTSLNEGQGGAGAGEYPGKDSQRFSESSSGSDRFASNPVPTIEANDRPVFLDRMNALNQPALQASDSASGRGETGQTTTVARASESERLSELRGAAPFSQSVTLDLDPLDMGPLRVRVMMSDQTVHAHIRTEHGELGQGLLQQGQSLESSLRTTGLEMGMLRVTVDQQQGRGDNAWMFQQQQQQGRPGSAAAPHSAAREEERSVGREQRIESSERVSFFA